MVGNAKALVASAEQTEAVFSTMYAIITAAMEVKNWAEAAATEQPAQARPDPELAKAA